MPLEPTKIVTVGPDSELGCLLDEATKEPLLLERDGVRFLLTRDPKEPFAYYDPERTREALREGRGILTGVDVKQLKADLRAQRGQGSSGRPA